MGTELKMEYLWLIGLVIGALCLVPDIAFAASEASGTVTLDVTNNETREIDTMMVVGAFTVTSAERDAGFAEEDPSTDLIVSANDSYKVQAKLTATSSKYGVAIKKDGASYTSALTTVYADIPSATGSSADNATIATTVKFTGLGWATVGSFANEQVTLNIKILSSV